MEQFIKKIAKQAGAILKDGFGKEQQISEKTSRWDFVTKYDIAAEQFLIKKIRRKYPDHGIWAEESGNQIVGKKQFWIIDPLDGTRGFAKGLPQFCVCIAFVSNDEIKYSVIYDPIRDELFYAAKGKGAFLNGKRIKVSPESKLFAGFFAYHISLLKPFRKYLKFVRDLLFEETMIGTKTTSGQLSGAYVAMGRYDAFFVKGLQPWDLAAAVLLIKEAGGKVSTLSGKPFKWSDDEVLAANPILHRKIMAKFKVLYNKKQ